MKSRSACARIAVVFTLAAAGCAHTPVEKGESPEQLLQAACGPGFSNQTVQGNVWMKLQSKETNGQFPATVSAKAPEQVTLEVTNLLGAREALIQIDHGSYSLEVPGKKGESAKTMTGEGSWGGIPLRWASALFLGRIPCPPLAPSSALHLRVSPEGQLTVEEATPAGNEVFTYEFHEWAGRPWPEALHWRSALTSVDFKFESPDDKTGTPKKWEAKSQRGSAKLRWTELHIVDTAGRLR